MKLEKYYKILNETSKETKAEIRFNMDVLDRIHELLNLKFGGKQKLLADKMGKSEAEISKLLSGIQNYTIKTIFKFENAFNERILAIVCSESDESVDYVAVKLSLNIKHSRMQVEFNGQLIESNIQYETFKLPKSLLDSVNKNLLA